MRNLLLNLTALAFCLVASPLAAQADVTAVYKRLEELDAVATPKLESGQYAEAVAYYKEGFELCRSTLKQTPNDAWLTESAYHYLTQLARCFERLNQPADAMSMQLKGTEGYESLARASTATKEQKNRATSELSNLSWMQLHAKDFAGALKSAQDGIEIDPSVIWINTNLAHALVLTGRVEEGRQLYLAHKNSVLEDGRAFRDVVLEDAKILREKAGITQLDAVIASVYGQSASAMPTVLGGQPATGSQSSTSTPSGKREISLKDFEGLEKHSVGKTIFVVVFIGLIFLFVIGMIILFWWLGKKRAEKLQKLAAELGLTYRAKPIPGDENLLGGSFLVQNHGGIRSIGNILEQRRGQDQIFIFDYIYHTGHNKQRRTHRQTIYYVASPRISLSAFLLRPETLGEKMTQWLGAKDINFPENPTFSGKFVLQGPDEAAIRRVFSPEVQQQCITKPFMYMEGRADRLFFFIRGKTLSPDNLQAFLNEGHAMADVFARSSTGAAAAPAPVVSSPAPSMAPPLPGTVTPAPIPAPAPAAGGPPPLPGAGS